MKNKFLISSTLFNALCFSCAYASNMGAILSGWHPVIGLAGAAGITTKLASSQTFPIIDVTTDEYYIYSSSGESQTQGLFEVFLGAENKIYPNWLLQTGVSYSQTGSYQARGSYIQGADEQSSNQFNYTYHLVAKNILLQAKLMRAYGEKFYPYLVAGLGGSSNKAFNYSSGVPDYLTFTRAYEDNTTTNFAYTVGAGVDMAVAKKWRLGLSYRFAGLGHADLGASTINGYSVPGTLSRASLNINEAMLQLTWIAG